MIKYPMVFIVVVFLSVFAALYFPGCSSGEDTVNRGSGDSGGDDDDDVEAPTIPQRYTIDGGEWVEEVPPPPTGTADSPTLLEVSGPAALINGGSGEYTISYDDPQGADTIKKLIVGNLGFSGHYSVPIAEPTGETAIWLSLMVTYADDLFQADFAVEDEDGNVSNYVSFQSMVVITGYGDIKVSLSFNKSVDLDLHVVEPTGEEIYYGYRDATSGGNLDLDSNPACYIDGVNNENIFWPEDSAPAGDYIVRVDYFEACVDDPVDYIVAVIIGDEVDVYQGTFQASDADAGGAGSGRDIVTFTYTP